MGRARLLLVAPANSIHTERWALALAGRDLDVHLAFCGNHAPTSAALRDGPVSLHPLPVPAPAGYLLDRLPLHRVIARLQPDVVHAHYATGYGTLASGSRARPVVQSVWGSDVFDFPMRSTLHRRLVGRNLARADALTSTSETMAAQVERLWPALRSKLSVVPFGVDTQRFAVRASPNVADVDDDVDDPVANDAVVFGTCKSLRPKYGIDVLIRAFARVVEHCDDAQLPAPELRIAGTGPQEPELRALAVSSGVGRRVEFLGAIDHDDVPTFLAGLDVFGAFSVLDSESFGVAVVEAMAVGLPTVVSDVAGFVEVTAPDTSIVVPRDDVAATAEALIALVADPERRRALGTRGRARVVERYDWQHNVSEMIDVYERVRPDLRWEA